MVRRKKDQEVQAEVVPSLEASGGIADERSRIGHLFVSVFKTESGKQVLEYLCRKHWVYETTWGGDREEMIRREGERALVLDILRLSNVRPESLIAEIGRQQAMNQARKISGALSGYFGPVV